MKRRFTEQQIAFALRQAASGTPVAEITRKMAVSEATFYRWKKQYAGIGGAMIRHISFCSRAWGERKHYLSVIAEKLSEKICV